MNVIVKYFNKRQGTIEALEDYSAMQAILDNTDQHIRESYEKLENISSPQLTGLPGAHNPKSGEERLVTGLDDITLLRERYADAKNYMEWFKPAWEALEEDAKFILKVCYLGGAPKGDAIEEICDRFHVERTTAYNKKNKALRQLAVLLFGK